jgi:hypothetical protein
MAAIAGYQADLYMASGAGVTFTEEAMTDSGDHTIYTPTTTAHRYWDDTATLLIEKSTDDGDNWSTVTNYTVDYVGGVVTFASANGGTDLIRASGKYLAISQVGQAFNWELSPSADILDITTFGDDWKVKRVGLHDATGKASQYYLDGTFFALLGSRFVMIFYPHFSAGERFEAYAYLKANSIKSAVADAIGEDLDWEVDGKVFYRAS